MGYFKDKLLEGINYNFIEFKCPKCKKKVYADDDHYGDLSEGQQADHSAGQRLCPKCNWYGQPEEVMKRMNEELKEEIKSLKDEEC
jgi:NAD-dependent SIR2 family protein deacetylase